MPTRHLGDLAAERNDAVTHTLAILTVGAPASVDLNADDRDEDNLGDDEVNRRQQRRQQRRTGRLPPEGDGS